jgi:hypothetical protein
MRIPRRAVQRFAENDLDQFDASRIETSHAPVYVKLSRKSGEEEPVQAFRLVEPLSPCRTGRAAQVSDLSGIRSREGVLRVVAEMAADLRDGGAAEWENGTLARFLEAYRSFLGDLDGCFAALGEQVPPQPDWGLLAMLLVAASGYE